MCRDSSCLIVKSIEHKRFGVIATSKITGEEIKKVLVAFIDNNDMVTDGDNAEKNVEIIATEHNDLCSATGDCTEEEKSKCHTCQ